jgi:DNA-binding CsgD family transcriptional regulator
MITAYIRAYSKYDYLALNGSFSEFQAWIFLGQSCFFDFPLIRFVLHSGPNFLLRVAGGKKYISPAVAEMLANELGTDDNKLPHQTLSDREYQIFLLLASAKTVTEIADALALSVKTISTYRSRILEKMNLHNNAELMRYAIDHRLAQ